MKKQFCAMLALLLGLMFVIGCGSGDTAGGRPWRDYVADTSAISQLPELGGATPALHTSYDRTGGNNDYNYFLRPGSEPGWVVLADLTGPGVVRRFWTTGIENGHPFKLYFDGEKRPRFSGTVDELFGQVSPFVYPLAQHLNQCWWSYVPLTFRTALRIEAKHPPTHRFWGPRRMYFQLNVEPLSAEAAPQSFPAQLKTADTEAVQHAVSTWTEALTWPKPPSEWMTTMILPAGTTGQIWEAAGAGTLEQWDISVEPTAEGWSQKAKEQMLQDVVLQVRYEGQAEPSIDVPIGDFFCNAWRKRSFGSLLLGSAPWGYQCRLPMPFTSRIAFTLINGADREVRIRFTPRFAPGAPAHTGYLHAEWRKSGPEAGRPHVVTDIQGQGKFIGCFLGVTGLDKSWWILEGDDQYYVDGARQPTWHGTGLEDYFNGGWYYRGASFTALSGVLDRYPFRTAQYRFHLHDPVHFAQSLRMQFERGDQNVSHGYLRSVAYLYLAQPRGVAPVPADRAVRRGEENPLEQYSLMLQLFELERMNNFASAQAQVTEWLEENPQHADAGVLRLRQLEYRRLLGEAVPDAEYLPFREGQHGAAAAEQAKLLAWFYAEPNRALVGACLNGVGKVYLDGREILSANSPVDLAVAGVELGAGAHLLAASVTAERPTPWAQFGVRMTGGIAGTGPGTAATRTPRTGWQTAPGDALEGWAKTVSMDCMRGPPHDETYMSGRANAFVLLQSKVYGIRVADWDAHKGSGYFRVPFSAPLTNRSSMATQVTGLAE